MALPFLETLQKVGSKVATLAGRDSVIVRNARPGYEWALAALSMGRGIPWDINGIRFRIDPRFRHLLGHDYDSGVFNALKNRVARGGTCFDVGANVGVYVLQLAKLVGPTGRIVAFEPNPSALTVLERHVAMNKLGDVVTVVPKAVGSKKDQISFFSVGADGMGRLESPNPLHRNRATESKVDVITLDDFIESSGIEPDWIFIDIEGFEFHSLLGLTRTLLKRPGQVELVLEFHPNAWDSVGIPEKAAKHFLERFGLFPNPLTGQKDPWKEYGIVHLVKTPLAQRTG